MKNNPTCLLMTPALFTLMLFSACKKDDTPPPATESHIGRYVVSTPGFGYKYIEISEDTLYYFTETGYYNLRNKQSFVYTLSGDTLIFQYGPPAKFTIQNGTLTLINPPYYTGTITAERSSGVPSANTWVKPTYVAYIGAINSGSSATDRYRDLTYYFGNVVTEPHYNGTNYVFKNITVNGNSYTATEIPVDPFYTASVGYEDNIEFYNGKFLVYEWGNPNSKMYRINPNTGIVENQLLVNNPVGDIYALATDGTSLFGMTYTGIRKFDFVNNQWEYEATTGGAGAMAGRNGFLYFTTGNSTFIQKANSSNLKVEGAYEIPGSYSVEGLAFLNDYTLLACLYNYNTTAYGMYVINLN
jgi:hypothetical protein